MKKALKIEDNYYFNMDSIVTLSIQEDYIQMGTTNPEIYLDIATGRSDSLFRPNIQVVSIQEFHRIQRELEEYMGINPKLKAVSNK